MVTVSVADACAPLEPCEARARRESAMDSVIVLPLRVLAENIPEIREHVEHTPGVLRPSWYCSSSSAQLKNGLVMQPGRHLSSASTPSPSSPSPPAPLVESLADPPTFGPSASSDGPPANLSSNGAITRKTWGRVSLRLKKGLNTTFDLVQLGLERVDRIIPWLLKPASDVLLGVELPWPSPEEDCLSVGSWSELLDVEVLCSLGEAQEREEEEEEREQDRVFKETVRWLYWVVGEGHWCHALPPQPPYGGPF